MMRTVLTSNSNIISATMAAKHQQHTNNNIVNDQKILTSSNVTSCILTSCVTTATTTTHGYQMKRRSPQPIIPNIKCIRTYTTFTVLFVFMILLLIPASVHPQPLGILSRDEQQNVPNRRYCSAALFEAIRLICNGRYNSLSNKYPESIGNNRSDPLKRLMSEDDDVIYRPTFGGAAHECCRRSCGYSELRSYCAD